MGSRFRDCGASDLSFWGVSIPAVLLRLFLLELVATAVEVSVFDKEQTQKHQGKVHTNTSALFLETFI